MSQQPAQTTNTESIRKLKDLTGGKQLGPVPRAMHMTRQFDADWRNSTPLDTEAEAVLRGLRPNLEHLSPTIGTVVHGVDLSQPMAPPLVRALRRLLLERKAIFFREQHLTPAQQLRFARGFGELEIHPFTQGRRGFPELLSIEHGADSVGGENVFHSDVTWRECPSLGSVLYAREVPSASACGGAGGGDTLFVDAYAMAEAIEPGLRAKIEGLTAEHDSHFFRAGLAASGTSPEELAALQAKYPPQSHPVIRTHPETGRKLLFVNPAFTTKIEGLPDAEQAPTLGYLYDLAKVPEFACRFQWEAGSVAFWDNRATQHYASSDYYPSIRKMDRATIVGDKPFYLNSNL